MVDLSQAYHWVGGGIQKCRLGGNRCQKLNLNTCGLGACLYFLLPLDQIVYETGLDFVVFTVVPAGVLLL